MQNFKTKCIFYGKYVLKIFSHILLNSGDRNTQFQKSWHEITLTVFIYEYFFKTFIKRRKSQSFSFEELAIRKDCESQNKYKTERK